MKFVHAFAIAFQFTCMVAFAYVGAWPWAIWCSVFLAYSMWQIRKGKAAQTVKGKG